MEIREIKAGDILVLAPEGSIEGREETSAIEAKLGTALKTGSRFLVLDCTSVGQLTGAAIRVLLMTSRKLGSKGRLVLCGMNAKVQKAFAISGFDKDFSIVASREEALRLVLVPVQPRAVRTPKVPLLKPRVIKEMVAAPAIETGSEAPAIETGPEAPAAPEIAAVAPAVATSEVEFAPTGPASESVGHDGLVAAVLDALGRPNLHLATAHHPVRSDLEDVAIGVLAALRVHEGLTGEVKTWGRQPRTEG